MNGHIDQTPEVSLIQNNHLNKVPKYKKNVKTKQ